MIKDEGQIIYVVERPTCRSTVFVEMIEKFGQANGFESILKVIADPKTSLKHAYYLCDLLSNFKPMFHKSFIDHYLTRFADTVEQRLMKASSKSEVEAHPLMERMRTILSRLHTEDELEIKRNSVLLKVGIMFLQ